MSPIGIYCFSRAWISTGASCLPMRSVCMWFRDPPARHSSGGAPNYRCGPGASGRNRARCLASNRTACLIRAKGNLNINQVDAIYGTTLHGIIHHHTWQQKSLLVASRFGESDVNRANSSRLIRIIPYSIGGPRGLLSTREPKESHWPAFICTLSHVHWGRNSTVPWQLKIGRPGSHEEVLVEVKSSGDATWDFAMQWKLLRWPLCHLAWLEVITLHGPPVLLFPWSSVALDLVQFCAMV
jgi:hypothetical protein